MNKASIDILKAKLSSGHGGKNLVTLRALAISSAAGSEAALWAFPSRTFCFIAA